MGVLERIGERAAVLRGDGHAERAGFVWPFEQHRLADGQGMFFAAAPAGAGPNEELADSAFTTLVNAALRANSVVFGLELKRLSIFTEARFMYRRLRAGRPGDLFGTADLDILEHPWPGAYTGDLLARMLLHADFAGNGFTTRWAERPDRLRQVRPDWMTIVMGSPDDPQIPSSDLRSELLGYIYDPQDGGEPEALTPAEVAHFAPFPDPVANFRGMSWLTPVIRELMADNAATSHKLMFFEQGATPQMVVKWPDKGAESVSQDSFEKFVAKMDASHKGWRSAYKTLYIGGGADVTVVGKDLAQLDFKNTQGAGETRIAAASGIHPVVAGLSEGLAGSSLNAGNFAAARRSVADTTMSWLWRCAAGSLANIVDVPADAELWYDARDIPFLREDRKDAAEIQQIKAITIRQLIEAGYDAASVVRAVQAEDMTLLVHTGMTSVQLQPPGMPGQPSAPAVPAPASNGNGRQPAANGAGRS